MSLEKVEIYGFKSFADKAEIKFGDGITGIVGPNGCGKSNVSDAIRWVLGEQSAKSLRGGKMEDVIFAGTQDRKSLSYCEVSLIFDNTDKMFSLDYAEVIITRKLYRSGESEYFINRQQARLKDIVDLLHECGIGKEGYTIIGQGKVEEIMSAKPEDRRLIFEEATGIAKFKSKKNESERKLERTHENVVRYADIITEIEGQLGPLEKQSAKTKEYNEISEQLKFHELNTYIAKADGVETAKNKINTRIKGIEEQTRLRQSEYNRRQEEYEKVFAESDKADEKLRKLHDELLDKTVGIERSSNAKMLYDEKISSLAGQVRRAENEIAENDVLVAECKKSIQDGNVKLQGDREKLGKLNVKSDALRKKLLTLNEKIAVGEELSHANQKLIIESIESLSDVRVNKSEIEIRYENITKKIEELSATFDERSVKRENLFHEKDACDNNVNDLDRTIFEFKNKIENKEDEIRAVNEEIAKIDNSVYTLNSLVATLKSKDSFYKSIKETYEGYIQSVKLLLNAAKNNAELKKRIKGVVTELISCDKIYDVAMETALGNAAQNIVTYSPDEAKYLIEYLKKNNYGRATFLPITSVKPRVQTVEITNALNERGAMGVANALVKYDDEYENVISNLLGNTLIVDNLENATAIARKYRFAFKIVTLEGEVFSTQGSMTGGSGRKESTGLLSGDRKREENAALLEKKTAEMDKLKEEKSVKEKTRDEALEELSLLNDTYNSKRQQLYGEREKQSITERNLSEIEREMESLSETIESLRESATQLAEKLEATKRGGKKLEEDRENVSKTANKQRQEYEEMNKERALLNEENNALQVEITELKAEINVLENDKIRLEKTVAETEASTERLKKSNEGGLAIIEELKREKEKIALTKEEQEQAAALRKEIDDIETYKEALRVKLTENAEEKERLTGEINELTDKKHDEELALSKIDSDLEYMGKSIYEDYQETYETALAVKEEGYDAARGEQEINRLRRRKSALGAINPNAIEDYKAVKERYEEMLSQKEDLEKAESDLRSAIDKIKAEMLTQFDEGFVKINQNFQKIFKELFGGGRAMLQMDYTEVDDKLEAGVEIVAEPPGKKLQKLSLLSGGEKALTAIAILFAILKMRPMPFCVLDEVEAALDEANVDRFARYLQKFSNDTQFIVITHKKPTMERADSLFGVTMQEKGVSKMVSVKLSDVSQWEGESIST